MTSLKGGKIYNRYLSATQFFFGSTAISHHVVTAGTHTTAGGDASESITDATVLATDTVMVMIKTEGSTPVTCDAATAAAGSITVTMSADPSTDHVLQYVVYRAV
jgi:hypothetical protein